MSWISFICLTCIVLLPLLTGLPGLRRTRSNGSIGERESALQLYRGQLQELDRDVSSGLLAIEERDHARLEIQRRLLAADGQKDRTLPSQTGSRLRAILMICMLPIGGAGLYLLNGHPLLPAQPHNATALSETPGIRVLFNRLEKQVGAMSPGNPAYISQLVLLGRVEEAMNRNDDAIRSYRQALSVHFIPELAVQLAELESQRDGQISAESLTLYRKALDQAPTDAPWRLAVEARIASGEHEATH